MSIKPMSKEPCIFLGKKIDLVAFRHKVIVLIISNHIGAKLIQKEEMVL